jgi:hypothetical protein
MYFLLLILLDFVLIVTFIGKFSGFRLYQLFLLLRVSFFYEDYKESWWNRTDWKYRYNLPLYSRQIRYRLGNSEKMTKWKKRPFFPELQTFERTLFCCSSTHASPDSPDKNSIEMKMSTSVDGMMLTERYWSVRVETNTRGTSSTTDLIWIETISKPDLSKGRISYNLRSCSDPKPQRTNPVFIGER